MTTFFRAAVLAGTTLIPFLARAATPVAEYNFQNTLSSSVAGAPDLVNLVDTARKVPNVFTTAIVDGMARTVLRFPQSNGVALGPTTGLISNDVYSIEILFSFDETDGYRRILDFLNGESQSGVYNLDGELIFYPGQQSADAAPITADDFHHLVITRDAGGRVTGFIDGVQRLSYDDRARYGAVDEESNRLRFFQDNTDGGAEGESASGEVARIRIYNTVLTAQEIVALDRLPDGGSTRLDLIKVIGGLRPAMPSEVTAFDLDGDGALTVTDLVRLLRGEKGSATERIRLRYGALAHATAAEDIDAAMDIFSTHYLNGGYSYTDVRNGLAQLFDVFDNIEDSYTIHSLSVDGDFATVYATEHITGNNTFSPGMPRESSDNTFAEIWHHENGDWYIYGNQKAGASAAPQIPSDQLLRNIRHR